MRGVSTFGAFTMARLGIYASQKGLDVTGNNISNINTTGYTRQVLDQISLRVGGKDRYSSTYDSRTGSGTLVTGISQIRDPYLDIRFRTEQASVGAMDAKLAGLEDLAGVLDEVADGEGDGILQAQFNDLVSQLQALSNGRVTDDSLVRSSADSLVKLFNNYASRLEGIKEDYEDILEQDVKDVNDILTSIRELNESIQKSEIHGDSALEMRDERNLLLDRLSEYMKIDVIYEPVQIGAGAAVDKLVIRTSGNPSRTIVDGSYVAELSLRKDAGGTAPDDNYNLDLGPLKDKEGRVLALKTEVSTLSHPVLSTLEDAQNWLKDNITDSAKLPTTQYEVFQEEDGNGGFIYRIRQIAEETSTVREDLSKAEADALLAEFKSVSYKVTETDAGKFKLQKIVEKLVENPLNDPGQEFSSKEQADIWIGQMESAQYTPVQKTGGEGDPVYAIQREVNGTTVILDGDFSSEDEANAKIAELSEIKYESVEKTDDQGNLVYGIRQTREETTDIGEFTTEAEAEAQKSKLSQIEYEAVEKTDDQGDPVYEIRQTVKKETIVSGLEFSQESDAEDWKKAFAPQNVDKGEGILTSAQYSVVSTVDENDNPVYKIQQTLEKTSASIELSDTELYGALQSDRELLTEKGEFTTTAEQADDANATTKRGIPYYQNALDALARKFAQVLNDANTGYLRNDKGEYVNSDGEVIDFIPDANGDYLDSEGNVVFFSDEVNGVLTNEQKVALLDANENLDGVALGGALFSTSSAGNETDRITAANISISKQWSTGAVSIQNSFVQGASKPGQVNSGDFSNIEHIIVLMDGKQEYKPNEIKGDAVDGTTPYFKGSFQEFLTSLQGTLAKDIKSTTTLLDNYSAAATELDTSRDSVSGVDLNDEAVNMMQYQKSYSAACRMMTTLDEALDKLINGTGVAGR